MARVVQAKRFEDPSYLLSILYCIAISRLARLHLRSLMHDPALVKHRKNLTHLQSQAGNQQIELV
jgi:hypothetical protein